MHAVLEVLGLMGVVYIIKGSDYNLKCAFGDLNSDSGLTVEFML